MSTTATGANSSTPSRAATSAGTGARSEARPGAPRFGYALLVRRLLDYRNEEAAGAASPAMDRRRVLARLAAELDAPPELLLERGFDRAYRQVVEGV